MSPILLVALLAAGSPPKKLPPDTAKEITAAIIAVDKALGLESWPSHGIKPCISRGGEAGPGKDVSAEDTKRCAEAAVEKGFPQLGKSYVLAVLMAKVGPMTVMAIGIGPAEGWAARSCDPERKSCPPVPEEPSNKWGKHLLEVHGKACAESGTLWLPATGRTCPDQSKK